MAKRTKPAAHRPISADRALSLEMYVGRQFLGAIDGPPHALAVADAERTIIGTFSDLASARAALREAWEH